MEIHDGPDLDTTAITVTVTDNGPGIPDAVVERVLDFGNLFSDKATYRSPTRGPAG